MTDPLLRKVDCIEIAVPDLEQGLAFYRDKLGHALIWRSATSAGLRMPETDAEIVLQSERPALAVDFLVDSADAAAQQFEALGGQVLVRPFDIQIGRAVVVEDPFGNTFVLLDVRKGLLVTDEAGNITGTKHPQEQHEEQG